MLEITSKQIYCIFIQYIEVVLMFNINKPNLDLINNNLATKPFVNPILNEDKNSQWCNIVNITNSCDISENYQNICKNHCTDNKWILMINPDEKPLDQLSAAGKINPTKILKVNANKVNVNFQHIRNTLLKGTCSAIILSKTIFSQAELNELAHCAEQGKTQCILMQQSFPTIKSQLH